MIKIILSQIIKCCLNLARRTLNFTAKFAILFLNLAVIVRLKNG